MTWPPTSPNLNPIKDYWSLLERELYVGGKQYSSKESLWNEMRWRQLQRLRSDVVQNLTATMDSRLVKIIEKKGGHINIQLYIVVVCIVLYL